ncbi:MAG: hypothetical protein L0241_13755 [Planctomycetia bacterium]|nr:hypothetical protein [Planctomycetia bacterium]
MNRTKTRKWAVRVAVWGTLVALFAIGCNPLNVAAYFLAREEKVPARYPLEFDKEGPKKDKEEVAVAFLTQKAPGAGREFATADRDLAEKLAKRLPEMAKESKKKIRVISPTQMDKFKIANPRWKELGTAEIGQKLGADFVLEVWMDKMRLYQPGSQNNIYEGRAEVTVRIYDVDGPEGGLKDRYMHPFAYPPGIVRDASVMPESQFKMYFLDNLATEICRYHIDTKASTGIAEGR